ncbi:MAG: endolytic transglycosylase MltG [Pseudomonadota bacterium]
MRHFAANAITILIVLCIVAAGAAVWGVQKWSAAGPLTDDQRFVVESGATLNLVSEKLENEGLISSGSVFRIGARYRKAATKLKSGEYEIPAYASMEEVLDVIVTGKSIQYKITLAEGLTSWEIVEALKANELLTGEITEVPPEGSLAPNTYFFAREANRNGQTRLSCHRTHRDRRALLDDVCEGQQLGGGGRQNHHGPETRGIRCSTA